MRSLAVSAFLALTGLPAAAQSVEDVGDPDSFNRDVKFLGNAFVNMMYMKSDCTRERQRGLHCTVLLPQPQLTSFELNDLATIRLPGRAANSLICWDLTPLIDVRFENTTAVTQPNASFYANMTLTFRSPVLEDPTLLNPSTGLPYNGEIRMSMVPYSEGMTLAAGHQNTKSFHMTRRCAQAAITRRALMESFGLSQWQANSFFNNEITVVLGAGAAARVVTGANFNVSLRLYGDRR